MNIDKKKVIIAGSRGYNDKGRLHSVMISLFSGPLYSVSEQIIVVSGCARGADSLGLEWATKNNVEVIKKPAEWDVFGKRAGYKRNEGMAKIADTLILFWDGESRGSKHMLDLALKYGLETHIYFF